MKIYEEMDMWQFAGDPRNSMSFWWPRIRRLEIPQPETKKLELDRRAYFKSLFDDDHNTPPPVGDFDKMAEIAKSLGYPVFMRTSETSGKHQWNETCYVESPTKLKQNFWTLLEDNYLKIDHIPDAVFFRKFIPMESYFTGWYHEFPVNKEMRTFIRDGKVECYHPYWPIGAMKQAKPKDPDWEEKFKKLCQLSEYDELTVLTYSNMVAQTFKEKYDDSGWWSVDFAKGKDREWYLIDMALGPISAHFNCKYKPKVRMKDGKIRVEKDDA